MPSGRAKRQLDPTSFEFFLDRIIQRCEKPGPFFEVLHATDVDRRCP